MTRDETADQREEGWPEPLPDAVRRRVVSVASATLPELAADEVPAGLRPFVRFTRQRRTKLAASALASALETDRAFRQRVAERLRNTESELVDAVLTGPVPPAADPVEVAAAAYLLRPTGWGEIVGRARREADRTEALDVAEREAEQGSRLREQLNQERTAARETRDKQRAEVARLKEENQNLRQKLHQTRDRARTAEAEVERLQRTRSEADERAARSEAELRRLRAKLADAEAAGEANRRAAREERDQESVRLRLLVDTVVAAAQGLRRELALPPVHDLPADAVHAQQPPEPAMSGAGTARDDGAYLNAVLAMPRVHLVVDGYNVTKTAWPSLPLQAQRARLVSALGDLRARTGAEITSVFDGADLSTPPPMAVPRGVRVRFSPAGVSADDVIARLVAAEPQGRPVVVVSSDGEVAEHSRSCGAQPVPAAALLRQLGV